MNTTRFITRTTAALAALALAWGCNAPGSGGSGGNLQLPTPDSVTADTGADLNLPDGITLDVPVSPDGTVVPDGTVLPDAVVVPDTAPDTAIQPDAPVAPVTMTVPEIQQASEAAGCDEAAIVNGVDVLLYGAIVVSPTFSVSGSLSGFYVADPAGATTWGGLLITGETATIPLVAEGDRVDVTGGIVEFYCNTQLTADGITVAGAAAVPNPQVITAPAEQYEDMLVRLEGVVVVGEVAAGVYDIGNGLSVGHDFDFFLSMIVGQTYTVTGMLKWSFGAWQVMPRYESDVQLSGPAQTTTISTIQTSADSITCPGSSIVDIAPNLTVEGTVSVARYDVSTSLHGYHISGPSNTPNNAIAVVVPKTLATNFAVGDSVRVTGSHVEYYCMTQLSADSMELLGAAAAPTAFGVGANEWQSAAESLEGVVVQTVLTVADSPDFVTYGEIATTAMVDGTAVIIDDVILGDGNLTLPATGTTVEVVGAVHYAFGAYRVLPRTSADLLSGF